MIWNRHETHTYCEVWSGEIAAAALRVHALHRPPAPVLSVTWTFYSACDFVNEAAERWDLENYDLVGAWGLLYHGCVMEVISGGKSDSGGWTAA